MIAEKQVVCWLLSLRNKEWPIFLKFVSSPYHNDDLRLVELAKQYQSAKPIGFKLEAATVMQAISKNAMFSRRTWTELHRRLLKLIEDFSLLEYLRQEPLAGALAATHSRWQRNLYNLGTFSLEARQKELENKEGQLPPWEVATEYRRLYQQEYESYGGRFDAEDVHKLLKEQRLANCLIELRYRIDLLLEGRYPKGEPLVIAEGLVLSADQMVDEYPILRLYLYTYRAFTGKEKDIELIAHTYQHLFNELCSADQRFFWVKIISLFHRSAQAMQPRVHRQLFDFQRFGVENWIFGPGEVMRERTFLNICATAVVVKELDWVSWFRKTFLPYIDNNDPHNASLFSAALIAYGYQKYQEVGELLKELYRPPHGLKMRAQNLQTQALTELYLLDSRYAPSLKKRLKAYYHFVYNDPYLPRPAKERFYHFISILRRLVRCREAGWESLEIQRELEKLLIANAEVVAASWLRNLISSLAIEKSDLRK